MEVISKSAGKKIILTVTGLLLIALIVSGVATAYFGPQLGIYLIPASPSKAGENALRMMDQGLYARGEEWHQRKLSSENLKNAQTWEELPLSSIAAIKVAGGRHSFTLPPSRTASSYHGLRNSFYQHK